jgi:Ca-activated chloride channel homolog
MRNALVVGLVALAACGQPAPAAAPAAPVANTAPADPEPVPSLAVVVVVDRSGSMQGMKLETTREAIRHLASVLPADAELGVIAFDTEPIVLVPLTTDPQLIASGLHRLEAGGGTNFYSGLVAGGELVATSSATVRHVIFLSDGEAPSQGVEDAARAIRASGATVSTVGIPEADQQLLDLIAQRGGGRAISLPDVGGLSFALEHELDYVIGR